MIYRFTGEMWLWVPKDGIKASSWHFISVPKYYADVIKKTCVHLGWGSVKITATIGGKSWKTSMFRKDETYIIPIKKEIREKCEVSNGDKVEISIAVE